VGNLELCGLCACHQFSNPDSCEQLCYGRANGNQARLILVSSGRCCLNLFSRPLFENKRRVDQQDQARVDHRRANFVSSGMCALLLLGSVFRNKMPLLVRSDKGVYSERKRSVMPERISEFLELIVVKFGKVLWPHARPEVRQSFVAT